MNHLDVGYNGIPALGLINNIIDRYFQVYFPRAIAVAAELRAKGGPERLVYTTHGWLASLYVHCPDAFTLSGIVLACPAPADVAAFVAAVQAGDIVWHAGAFNTEYENAFIEELVDAQFQPSFDLADELGVPRPRTVSLRDVPGTTRALVPILVRNNITAISIGVNGGSPAPAMPNPGVWRDPASSTSVLYMQTGQGQGYPNNPGPDPANCGGMCASSCVTFSGLTHALCWAFRTDNSGPPMDADEVYRQFDIARWQFPGANVYASTYDNFTAQLATVEAQLPVSTAEVGDTWMTSTTADSWKQVFYREAGRAFKICLDTAQCDVHDPRVFAFLRMLIKIPEHTYGLPGLDDHENFTNDQVGQAALRSALRDAPPLPPATPRHRPTSLPLLHTHPPHTPPPPPSSSTPSLRRASRRTLTRCTRTRSSATSRRARACGTWRTTPSPRTSPRAWRRSCPLCPT